MLPLYSGVGLWRRVGLPQVAMFDSPDDWLQTAFGRRPPGRHDGVDGLYIGHSGSSATEQMLAVGLAALYTVSIPTSALMSMCSVACGQRGQSLRCAVISRYVANTVAKAVPSYFRRFVYLNCNVVGPCYFILRERRIGHTTTPLHSVHVRADVHLFQIFALDLVTMFFYFWHYLPVLQVPVQIRTLCYVYEYCLLKCIIASFSS